jgi:1-acyl-sn-glycerol-3-phosphate acyltransferase
VADPVAGALRRGFAQLVRSGLRGVWARGGLPATPFVWAANHHSWWDPFLAAVVLDRLRLSGALLMAPQNLARYGFARRLGVFGGDQPRRGLDLLRAGRTLVIYPEGELRPAGRLGGLARGAAWYACSAPAPLYAVATRVVMRGHQAPEAYLVFEPVDMNGSRVAVTARLATQLGTALSELDDLIAATEPRSELPGFTLLVRGRRSWDERIDRMASGLRWPAG